MMSDPNYVEDGDSKGTTSRCSRRDAIWRIGIAEAALGLALGRTKFDALKVNIECVGI